MLAGMERTPEKFPDIHPNIAEIFTAKVMPLSEVWTDPSATLRDEVGNCIREGPRCGPDQRGRAAGAEGDGSMLAARQSARKTSSGVR